MQQSEHPACHCDIKQPMLCGCSSSYSLELHYMGDQQFNCSPLYFQRQPTLANKITTVGGGGELGSLGARRPAYMPVVTLTLPSTQKAENSN